MGEIGGMSGEIESHPNECGLAQSLYETMTGDSKRKGGMEIDMLDDEQFMESNLVDRGEARHALSPFHPAHSGRHT